MSSSSSISGNYNRQRSNAGRGTPKNCWCGEPTPIFTSGSATNPGRLYYCCAKGYNKRHLFKWADECLVEEVEDIKSVISGMNNKISELRHNVARLEVRKGDECMIERRYLTTVAVCGVGMAIIWYYYLFV